MSDEVKETLINEPITDEQGYDENLTEEEKITQFKESIRNSIRTFEEDVQKAADRRLVYARPTVLLRYHKEKYPDLQEVEIHGNMVDLRVPVATVVKAGEYYQIPLGVSMKLPKGYWAQVVPRSSTFRKYGIIMANSFGVIDTDYCGDNDEWVFCAYATKDAVIPANERICQFRIVKDELFNIATVEKLEGPDRGGLGSTDNK